MSGYTRVEQPSLTAQYCAVINRLCGGSKQTSALQDRVSSVLALIKKRNEVGYGPGRESDLDLHVRIAVQDLNTAAARKGLHYRIERVSVKSGKSCCLRWSGFQPFKDYEHLYLLVGKPPRQSNSSCIIS